MNTTWSPTTRILVVTVILLGAVWLAVMASPLLNALVISVLLAYLLDPVVRLLTRRTRLNRSLAAVFVYLLFLLVLASIPTALGVVAVDQFRRLEADFAAALDALGQWLFQPIDVLGYQLYPQTLLDNLEQFAGDALTALPSGSLGVLSDVTTNLLWGLVILVSLYYFLKDGPRVKPWLVGFAPDEYQAEMRRLLDEVDKVWGVFLRVQLLIFVVLATLMATGTFLVIWLFRTGLLELSPFGLILLLILIYAAVQQVDNLWLRPQLMGKQLRLHPGLVFVGLLGALSLSGVLGAIVVVPCMATVKVIGRYVHRKLLGLAPWPQEDMVVVGEEEQEDDSVGQLDGKSDTASGVVRWLLQIGVFTLILAASLFISSGRLNWVMAWVYIAVFVASQGLTALILIPSNPELLTERAESKGPRDLDRVLAGFVALFGPVSMWIVAGLDVRFGWLPQIPLALQIAALAVVALGSLLTIWAMASNKFFYGVVRIAQDRGHTVAASGPYRFVRHPGYVGGILFDFVTPLVLGSLWALIPAAITVCILVVRTVLEDRRLQDELDGYQEYAARVRYRLLPGVW